MVLGLFRRRRAANANTAARKRSTPALALRDLPDDMIRAIGNALSPRNQVRLAAASKPVAAAMRQHVRTAGAPYAMLAGEIKLLHAFESRGPGGSYANFRRQHGQPGAAHLPRGVTMRIVPRGEGFDICFCQGPTRLVTYRVVYTRMMGRYRRGVAYDDPRLWKYSELSVDEAPGDRLHGAQHQRVIREVVRPVIDAAVSSRAVKGMRVVRKQPRRSLLSWR